MTVTIYHNPSWGTSSNVQALIRNAGIEPNIIEYLRTPPARQELKDLIRRAGLVLHSPLPLPMTPYA